MERWFSRPVVYPEIQPISLVEKTGGPWQELTVLWLGLEQN
jgi:hypothetical protein